LGYWDHATITPILQCPNTPSHGLEFEDGDEDEEENEVSAQIAAGTYERKTEIDIANSVE